MNALRLTGLVAATHTPFDDAGGLRLSVVEQQAGHLLRQGVRHAFVGGTTGESHSLTFGERQALARRWLEVVRGSDLRVIVHVGSNCLSEAALLARDAAEHGALAVAALTPSYFKPASVGALIECCRTIASAAPETPFYFYDIPALTGVNLSMPAFLEEAPGRVPNLAGIKFTNPDLMAYQLCLNAGGGRFDLPWGMDEALLAALAVGARGAVGSSYNFAAGVYHRVWEAFSRGDFATARAEQLKSVQWVRILARRGYLGAAKAVLRMQGVDVGPARAPLGNPRAEEVREMRRELEEAGLWEAIG